MNRRNFVKHFGYATLCLQVASLSKSFAEDSVTVQSEGWRFPHFHLLRVPKNEIMNPTEKGLTLRTEPSQGPINFIPGLWNHTHQVQLTQKDLLDIKVGREINVRDDSQVHTFTIKLV